MIKNMLERRKENDTYLVTFHRHHWRAQMMIEKDNLLELSVSTVALISLLPLQLMKATVLAERSNKLSFFIVICLRYCTISSLV
jgi:hypothetical protein